MNCMSAYSMPLCTILTKWPAPSGPIHAQHGSPSTWAEIDSSSGPSDAYDSFEPPGMIDGPSSAPTSPPEMPAPDEVQALLPQRLLAAAGVLEVGVAAVDDDVALLEQRRRARR